MGEQKKKKNASAKSGSASGGKKKLASKKPAAKKRVLRRVTIGTTKKVTAKKPTSKRVIRLAPAVTTVPLPLAVHPLAHQPLRRTDRHDNMSLRRHIVSVFSLVAVSVIALAVIAGFAQVTFMNINSLNTPMISLMKPVAIESRFFPSVAGELTLALPATWVMTNQGDNTITYMHATETGASLTITVQTNETENIFSWLQAHQPDYTNAVVVESDPAVTVWRGVTVTAETTDHVPLQIVYIPIQKNLGERYIVTLRAEMPSADADAFVQQAFDSLLENFATSLD